MVSTSSANDLFGFALYIAPFFSIFKNSSGKHAKIVRSGDENDGPKAEAESSSAPGSKTTEQDYIHVKAGKGQATGRHSLAERAMREKISERMKILQDLVLGCNKIIGKAMVLNEIINYIQSLQRQVEFLSMKLEAVGSRMNVNPSMEAFPSKELRTAPFDATGMMFASLVV